MAKFLVNAVHVGSSRFNPGDTIEAESEQAVLSAGGNLVDSATYPGIVDAAATATALRLLGRLEESAAFMQAAYSEAMAAKVRGYHATIVTASTAKSVTGKDPTAVDANALLLLAFTLDTDAAWRQFKIPFSFVGSPAVHVHWTKTGNANEAGKVAKWRISYVVFDGRTEDAAGAPSTVEYEDTYEDTGTTTRVVHRTPDLPLTGLAPGDYLSIKVEAITPAGTPLASEPGLFSLDLTFTEKINE